MPIMFELCINEARPKITYYRKDIYGVSGHLIYYDGFGRMLLIFFGKM